MEVIHTKATGLDVIHSAVAGLDVHKKTIVACVRLMEGSDVTRECRKFETTTDSLRQLLEWVEQCHCTHVGMEATGVYWMPVWRILSDGDFELLVGNAAHMKNVPGRKTDMNDAMWIADLVACGMVKGSFVPEEGIQDLRALTRTRKQLVREQVRHVQRIEKTLEQANIKLDAVLSDLMGASGRRILSAMIAGAGNAQKLAALGGRGLKASPQELQHALHGRLTRNHRFLLKLHLEQWDTIDKAIRKIDKEVDAHLARLDAELKEGEEPFRVLIPRLCEIPGVSKLSAITILSEIGRDLSRFETAGQFLAWAGLCPGHKESAGKRKSSRLRKGPPWLKTIMVQCGWAAKRKKGSYYMAQFFRLQAQRGPQKAICAVAASLLTAIYHMIVRRTPHKDLGADHFTKRSPERQIKRAVASLARLGFAVELKPLPKAA
jgi:transposase